MSVQIGQNHAGTEAARELGRRSAEVRARREAAIRRIVTETRRRQGLPPSIKSADVLERVAAQLENGDSNGPA